MGMMFIDIFDRSKSTPARADARPQLQRKAARRVQPLLQRLKIVKGWDFGFTTTKLPYCKKGHA